MLDSGKAIYRGLCRYVTLQTRNFGISLTKAKVDTGIKSRQITSQKGGREKSFKIHRIVSTKASIDFSSNRDTSLQKRLQQETGQQQEVKDFDRYINEIKEQKILNLEPEGGSDSEGSEDDLSFQELNKLFEYVQGRTDEIKDFNGKVCNLKPKTLEKIRQRKGSFQDLDESNKENTQMENIPVKVKLSNGMDTSRRLYQMSQKIRPLKKPPLPLININTKYVLCQKKFTVDF